VFQHQQGFFYAQNLGFSKVCQVDQNTFYLILIIFHFVILSIAKSHNTTGSCTMIHMMTGKEEQGFYSQLGQKIAEIRKQINLTQVQLAEMLGLTQPVLANYENGRRKIPVSVLIEIAITLEIPLEDLLPVDLNKKRRGPITKMDKELAKIKHLPVNQQKMVLEVIQSMLKHQ
jgi:transcriptional regulator with XRE-family HTH domain